MKNAHVRWFGLTALLGLRSVVDTPLADPAIAAPSVHPARQTPRVAASSPEIGPDSTVSRPVWRDDLVLLDAVQGASLDAIARDHGATLRGAPSRSGVATLAVGPGQTRDGLLAALAADPRVAHADRMGITYGASGWGHHDDDDHDGGCHGGGDDDDDDTTTAWHSELIGAPRSTGDLSGYVVAVLDTGVAYADGEEGGQTFSQAPSLADTSFTAPYDFVNEDSQPFDDHGHGTHIATVIGGQDTVQGVAPGVGLMPLKVLDADNTGTEADLIAAIEHAVDNGADVINLSLTFSEGYAPSWAMRGALEQAAAAGVVMVAAAGNDGAEATLYPAASRLVLSVGASQLDRHGDLEPADYSNQSLTVDLLAPGGNLEEDNNRDGLVDGILGESLDPSDPSDVGLWLYAGTSQATAITSGAVVHLLDAGLSDPELIAQTLQDGAESLRGYTVYKDGYGAGLLDIDESLDVVDDGDDASTDRVQTYVSVLGWLQSSSGGRKVRPSFQLSAVYADGSAASSLKLGGEIWDLDSSEVFVCTTDRDGVCTVTGDKVSAKDSHGDPEALAWGISVDGAMERSSTRVADRPAGALWATDALVVLAEALDEAGLPADAPLALRWDSGRTSGYGDVAEAYSIMNLSVGGAERPQALLFTPAVLDGLADATVTRVDLDAVALCDEELGELDVTLLDLDGAGLLGGPLSISDLSLTVLSVSGLLGGPLSLAPQDIFSFEGKGLLGGPLSVNSTPILLDSGTAVDASLDGYAIDSVLSSGGWLNTDGYAGATALMSSGAVGMSWEETALMASTQGGVALSP